MKNSKSGLHEITSDISARVHESFLEAMNVVVEKITEFTGSMEPIDFEAKYDLEAIDLPTNPEPMSQSTLVHKAIILGGKDSVKIHKVFIIEAGYKLNANFEKKELGAEIFSSVADAPTSIVTRTKS